MIMEMFLKDRKEVKEVSKRANSLLDEVLADRRLMAVLNGLQVDQKEIENNLSLLATFLDQRAAEENPKLPAPYPGMKMNLQLDDSGHLCAVFGPNDEEKKRMLLNENYIFKDFPDEWCSLDISHFKAERYKLLRIAIKFACEKTSRHRWVFVSGDPGTGKSQLLASSANRSALKNKSVAFINANERLDYLKQLAIKNKDEFAATMQKLKTCDLLVIDDLGNEYRTDYVRDQILMPILAERSRLSLATFITSQYSLKELNLLYSSRGTDFGGKRVAQIIERNIEKEVHLSFGLESVK